VYQVGINKGMYALVQETTTNTDMLPIFTSTQNKCGFVVPLFVVVNKNAFAKITFSLFGVLTFHLFREVERRRASCGEGLRLLANTW